MRGRKIPYHTAVRGKPHLTCRVDGGTMSPRHCLKCVNSEPDDQLAALLRRVENIKRTPR